MSKRLDNSSRLMELARRGRESQEGANDPVLGIAVTVLDLQDSIDELYEKIQKDTVYGTDENDKPRPLAFKHPVLVEDLEEKIAAMKETMSGLQELLSHIEKVFLEHGVGVKALYSLDEDLTALQNEPAKVAAAVNRRVRALIDSNPTIPLPLVFADKIVQELELKKSEVGANNASQIANLIQLKDALRQDLDEGQRIVGAVRHPGRIISQEELEGVLAL